jgi:hypothetical protein
MVRELSYDDSAICTDYLHRRPAHPVTIPFGTPVTNVGLQNIYNGWGSLTTYGAPVLGSAVAGMQREAQRWI